MAKLVFQVTLAQTICLMKHSSFPMHGFLSESRVFHVITKLWQIWISKLISEVLLQNLMGYIFLMGDSAGWGGGKVLKNEKVFRYSFFLIPCLNFKHFNKHV